ncbi:MAG: SulP family inorganic anion transporter [Candidatus Binatia bacterium]
MWLLRYLPFLDLASYRFRAFRRDLLASSTVTFLDIPQGVAYAMIAGLPPAMGLYAAAVPAIVGALFRSSRHVVTGPTNALSLLVGSAVAGAAAHTGAGPMEVGVTLAFFVGLMQFFAGLLRLDAVADYISLPVVRGYITGAAILIAVGQLPNVTGTAGSSGTLGPMLVAWSRDLSHPNPLAVTFACGTVVIVLLLRWVDRRMPGSLIVMVVSIGADSMLHLHAHGLRVVADIAPIPAGLPPLTVPSVQYWGTLAPAALACAVLSLVESSSVARALAARTGQQLDMAAEFAGQGLANLAAAFSGGYPVSGSLSRSALNQQAGAESRLSALFCGLLMLAVLLILGPVVGRTPVASLAGLLLVLANDLVDRQQIRMTLQGTMSDRAAFVATTVGTWVLPLDQAIYLGVGMSIILFLRRARLLTIREMTISEKRRFREIDPDANETGRSCSAIRIMNLTGPLFFAAAGELQSLLDRFLSDSRLRVLILRLRQADAVDVTTASVLEATAAKLAREGKTLLLLGVRPATMQLLERTGVAERLGREHLFPAQAGWFTAMEVALRRALALAGAHACGATCPLAEYVAAQETLRSAVKTA